MAHVHDLPDALLVAIFSHRGLHERQRTLRAVCRRWDDLVHSPELLRAVSARVLEAEGCWPRIESLLRWLQLRAGPHVRQLDLTLLPGAAIPANKEQYCPSMLAAALAACADSLLALRLVAGLLFLLGSWLPRLGRLRHLLVTPNAIHGLGMEDDRLQSSLNTLTDLQTLELDGTLAVSWNLDCFYQLPLSLTGLVFRQGLGCRLPQHQVNNCTNLRCLVLHSVDFDTHRPAPLAGLAASLTRLDLDQAWCIPDGLSLLSGLRSLTVRKAEDLEELGDEVEEVLPHLCMLQHLHLDCRPWPPPTLTALTALTSLCLVMGDLPEGTPLPPGPWLAGLRVLVAPCLEVAASLDALNSATQLRSIGITYAWEDEDCTHGIARWAAARPSLQHLVVPALHSSCVQLAALQQRAARVAVSAAASVQAALLPPEPVCPIRWTAA